MTIRSIVRSIFDRRKAAQPVPEERRKGRMTPSRAAAQLCTSIDNFSEAVGRAVREQKAK